jgi:hypothetical protein
LKEAFCILTFKSIGEIMDSFSKAFKENEIKQFKKAYKAEVGDVEKTYVIAKKSYERSLKAFVRKNITHESYQSLWIDAFEFTAESYVLHTNPDHVEVLKDLIRLHEIRMECGDFYGSGA